MVPSRDSVIIRTSFIGIASNLFLVAVKFIVGILSNSIAVTLDAVNNLSDALSSVITIIGTKLSMKGPDKTHPLGHGRIEYLSSMLISVIVLYAGFTSLIESVKKMIRPESAVYSALSLLLITFTVFVKLILGHYVRQQGKKVNSGALLASGSDAILDAVLSASVLASAIISLIWHLSLEAYVGMLISFVIIRAGIKMSAETLNDIIGKREDREIIDRVKQLLTDDPNVYGACDLILFDYGPDLHYGSVHLELPDTMTVEEVDQLTRILEARVFQETGIILTGIGVYSYNIRNPAATAIRDTLQDTLLAHDWALQMHGFHADFEHMILRFDVVISFEISRDDALMILYEEAGTLYPSYELQITADIDI